MRPTRAERFTRLATVQRLAQVIDDVRRWLSEVLAHARQTETATEKVERAEAVKQTGAMKPDAGIVGTVKPLTVREALQQRDAARRKMDRGIKPPGNASRSRGISH
jgi:hypothetical protein